MSAASPAVPAASHINWQEGEQILSALWRSESGMPAPKRVVIANDQTPADTAYRLACEGTALLWRGDFQNARQLLQAMARRAQAPKHKNKTEKISAASPAEAFHLHRQAQSQRARTLAMLLIELSADHVIPLRRAPDIKLACEQVYGIASSPYVVSLRELLGLIGAYEWRKKGVEIPALANQIHPHYGVFSPVRGEYIQLIADTPLPNMDLAFDIGTGTGVIAAVLAHRGVKKIIATDQDDRALNCAHENIERIGLSDRIDIAKADLFPTGQAPLIVCNPPWIPARPSSQIEHAIYDQDSHMLLGFLNGLAAHLTSDGEGWLILSDIAEHLGLRTRDELLAAIDKAGLTVKEKIDTKATHPRASDPTDPLHQARKAEVTSLWRLAAKS